MSSRYLSGISASAKAAASSSFSIRRKKKEPSPVPSSATSEQKSDEDVVDENSAASTPRSDRGASITPREQVSEQRRAFDSALAAGVKTVDRFVTISEVALNLKINNVEGSGKLLFFEASVIFEDDEGISAPVLNATGKPLSCRSYSELIVPTEVVIGSAPADNGGSGGDDGSVGGNKTERNVAWKDYQMVLGLNSEALKGLEVTLQVTFYEEQSKAGSGGGRGGRRSPSPSSTARESARSLSAGLSSGISLLSTRASSMRDRVRRTNSSPNAPPSPRGADDDDSGAAVEVGRVEWQLPHGLSHGSSLGEEGNVAVRRKTKRLTGEGKKYRGSATLLAVAMSENPPAFMNQATTTTENIEEESQEEVQREGGGEDEGRNMGGFASNAGAVQGSGCSSGGGSSGDGGKEERKKSNSSTPASLRLLSTKSQSLQEEKQNSELPNSTGDDVDDSGSASKETAATKNGDQDRSKEVDKYPNKSGSGSDHDGDDVVASLGDYNTSEGGEKEKSGDGSSQPSSSTVSSSSPSKKDAVEVPPIKNLALATVDAESKVVASGSGSGSAADEIDDAERRRTTRNSGRKNQNRPSQLSDTSAEEETTTTDELKQKGSASPRDRRRKSPQDKSPRDAAAALSTNVVDTSSSTPATTLASASTSTKEDTALTSDKASNNQATTAASATVETAAALVLKKEEEEGKVDNDDVDDDMTTVEVVTKKRGAGGGIGVGAKRVLLCLGDIEVHGLTLTQVEENAQHNLKVDANDKGSGDNETANQDDKSTSKVYFKILVDGIECYRSIPIAATSDMVGSIRGGKNKQIGEDDDQVLTSFNWAPMPMSSSLLTDKDTAAAADAAAAATDRQKAAHDFKTLMQAPPIALSLEGALSEELLTMPRTCDGGGGSGTLNEALEDLDLSIEIWQQLPLKRQTRQKVAAAAVAATADTAEESHQTPPDSSSHVLVATGRVSSGSLRVVAAEFIRDPSSTFTGLSAPLARGGGGVGGGERVWVSVGSPSSLSVTLDDLTATDHRAETAPNPSLPSSSAAGGTGVRFRCGFSAFALESEVVAVGKSAKSGIHRPSQAKVSSAAHSPSSPLGAPAQQMCDSPTVLGNATHRRRQLNKGRSGGGSLLARTVAQGNEDGGGKQRRLWRRELRSSTNRSLKVTVLNATPLGFDGAPLKASPASPASSAVKAEKTSGEEKLCSGDAPDPAVPPPPRSAAARLLSRFNDTFVRLRLVPKLTFQSSRRRNKKKAKAARLSGDEKKKASRMGSSGVVGDEDDDDAARRRFMLSDGGGPGSVARTSVASARRSAAVSRDEALVVSWSQTQRSSAASQGRQSRQQRSNSQGAEGEKEGQTLSLSLNHRGRSSMTPQNHFGDDARGSSSSSSSSSEEDDADESDGSEGESEGHEDEQLLNVARSMRSLGSEVFRRRDLDASVVIEYVGKMGQQNDSHHLSSSSRQQQQDMGGGEGQEVVFASKEMSLRQLLRLSVEQQRVSRQRISIGGASDGACAEEEKGGAMNSRQVEGFAVGNDDDDLGGDWVATTLTLEACPENASALAMLALRNDQEKEEGRGEGGGDANDGEGSGEEDDAAMLVTDEVPMRWELKLDVALEALDDDDDNDDEDEDEEGLGGNHDTKPVGRAEIGEEDSTRFLSASNQVYSSGHGGGNDGDDPATTLFRAPAAGAAAEEAEAATRASSGKQAAKEAEESARSRAQNRAKELVRRRKMMAKRDGHGGGESSHVADAVWEAQRLSQGGSACGGRGFAGRSREPAWRSEGSAATLVQAVFRGFVTRVRARRKFKACECVQRHIRGHLDRKRTQAKAGLRGQARREAQQRVARRHRLSVLEQEMKELRTTSAKDLGAIREKRREEERRAKEEAFVSERDKALTLGARPTKPHDSRDTANSAGNNSGRHGRRRHGKGLGDVAENGDGNFDDEEEGGGRTTTSAALRAMETLEAEALEAFLGRPTHNQGGNSSSDGAAADEGASMDALSAAAKARHRQRLSSSHQGQNGFTSSWRAILTAAAASAHQTCSASSSSTSPTSATTPSVFSVISAPPLVGSRKKSDPSGDGDSGKAADETADVNPADALLLDELHRSVCSEYARRSMASTPHTGPARSQKGQRVAAATLASAATGSCSSGGGKYQDILEARRTAAILFGQRMLSGPSASFQLEASESRREHLRHLDSVLGHLEDAPSLQEMRERVATTTAGRGVQEKEVVLGGDGKEVEWSPPPSTSSLRSLLFAPSSDPSVRASHETANQRTLAALQCFQPQTATTMTTGAMDSAGGGGGGNAWWAATLPEDLGSLPRDVRTLQHAGSRGNPPFQEWNSQASTAAALNKNKNQATESSKAVSVGGGPGCDDDISGDGGDMDCGDGAGRRFVDDEESSSVWWYAYGRKVVSIDAKSGDKKVTFVDVQTEVREEEDGDTDDGEDEDEIDDGFVFPQGQMGGKTRANGDTPKVQGGGVLSVSQAELMKKWSELGALGRRRKAAQQNSALEKRGQQWAAAICEEVSRQRRLVYGPQKLKEMVRSRAATLSAHAVVVQKWWRRCSAVEAAQQQQAQGRLLTALSTLVGELQNQNQPRHQQSQRQVQPRPPQDNILNALASVLVGGGGQQPHPHQQQHMHPHALSPSSHLQHHQQEQQHYQNHHSSPQPHAHAPHYQRQPLSSVGAGGGTHGVKGCGSGSGRNGQPHTPDWHLPGAHSGIDGFSNEQRRKQTQDRQDCADVSDVDERTSEAVSKTAARAGASKSVLTSPPRQGAQVSSSTEAASTTEGGTAAVLSPKQQSGHLPAEIEVAEGGLGKGGRTTKSSSGGGDGDNGDTADAFPSGVSDDAAAAGALSPRASQKRSPRMQTTPRRQSMSPPLSPALSKTPKPLEVPSLKPMKVVRTPPRSSSSKEHTSTAPASSAGGGGAAQMSVQRSAQTNSEAAAAATDTAIAAANAETDEAAAAAAVASYSSQSPSTPVGAVPAGAFLAVGTSVEARYHGKKKWYKGVVKSVRHDPDVSYGILYEDGDFEESVAPDLVCSKATPGAFMVGARIEARYKGSSKWYRGEVQRDNGDGTYAVRYEDGDEEPHVYFIRFASLA